MRRDHGGNLRELLGARDRPAGPMLDLSASINPLGVSPQAIRALLEALPSITRYPDPEASALVEALSRYHAVPARHVVAGHGSTELIYLLARALAPRRALVVHPAFSEYEAALEPVGYALLGERTGERAEGWREPWGVSALAEAAGIAALADRAYRAQTLRVVPAWRAALCVGLEGLGGLRVYPSVTNYLLVGIERPG